MRHESQSTGMDFHLVRSTLLKEFDESEIKYAIIGGFALGLWEVTRATIDWELLREYFDLFERMDQFEDLKKTYG